jgi:hypothetical protein
MASQEPAPKTVRVRGPQRSQLEADLLAQIVVILGRQLAEEAADDLSAADNDVPNDAESIA